MDDDAQQETAFGALVVEHHVRLRAFVRSLGVDPDWVDDVAQEAFLVAYRQFESFDDTKDFGKWLRGIAANIVRNEIRKDARRQRILHNDLAELLIGRYEQTSHHSESMTIGAIKNCLEQLAPKSKTIVQGRYRHGLSAAQLADDLELTAANVRQLLVRIRRQLKSCVELQLAKES